MSRPPIRILYIEDDATEVELARMALNMVCPGTEFNFQLIHDGEKATEFLKSVTRDHVKPDLILLDLHLPRISGIELVNTARKIEHWNDVPLVIMTGAISPSQHAQIEALNVTSIIIKPLDLEGYKRVFKEICDFTLELTQA